MRRSLDGISQSIIRNCQIWKIAFEIERSVSIIIPRLFLGQLIGAVSKQVEILSATYDGIRYLHRQRNRGTTARLQFLSRTLLGCNLTFHSCSIRETIIRTHKDILTRLQISQIGFTRISCSIGNRYFLAWLDFAFNTQVLHIEISPLDSRRRRYSLILAPRLHDGRTVVLGRFLQYGIVAIGTYIDISQTIQAGIARNLDICTQRLLRTSSNPNGVLNLADQFTSRCILVDGSIKSIRKLCILYITTSMILHLPCKGNLLVCSKGIF